MSISRIESLACTEAKKVIISMKKSSPMRYLLQLDDQENLSGYNINVFDHKGLYGFCLKQKGKSVVIYVGKSENGTRLRQHLTGKNKDGTKLAKSVKHKNENIKEAIRSGYSVYLCLYADKEFKKASLSCIEIASIEHAKNDMKTIFSTVKHWNQRNS